MSYLSSVIDRDKCVCPGLRCLFADHGAACTDSISRSPKTPRSSSSPGRTGRARTGMQTRAWTTRCARLSLCAILGRRNGEQMIIHIPFTENVRLRSILLKLGEVQVIINDYYCSSRYIYRTGRAHAAPPAHLRQPQHDRRLCGRGEHEAPAQHFASRGRDGRRRVPAARRCVCERAFPLSVFRECCACVFVAGVSFGQNESAGDDVSRLYFIGFKGDVRSTKQAVDSTLDVPAPNVGDAKLVDRLSEKAAGQQATAR
jgi:hypothetical protein